jgi:hypothetical protein
MIRGVGLEQVTRRRADSAVTWNSSGDPVAASTTDATIWAAVQQPTRAQIEQLDAGQRQRDPRRFLSSSELRAADQHTGRAADLVIFDGTTYVVVGVSHRRGASRGALAHYDAVALRETE